MGKSIFDNPDYDSPFGNWLKTDFTGSSSSSTKTLTIRFVSYNYDLSNYYLTFEIYAKNLNSYDAVIFVQEMNANNEIAVPRERIKLKENDKTIWTVSFPRTKKFDKFPWQDGFEYMGTIECDSLSKDTAEFSLKNATKGNKTTKDNNRKKENDKDKDTCFCNRDFTEQELKNIISSLRAIAKIKIADLFQKENCKLPDTQKSYNFLVSQLNIIFNKYNVTTCIRKLHFIAQTFHETDGFQTTLEYATNKEYAPHTGRGLMQLTWKSNYKIYSAYKQKDYLNNYKEVAENLIISADSGGWFWERGKVLAPGEIWKPSNNAPDYVKKHNPQYPKNNYVLKEFGNPSNQIKYGAVDLNLIADDDLVDIISYMVNGGANGIEERRKYVEKLKTTMKYDKCINKKK